MTNSNSQKQQINEWGTVTVTTWLVLTETKGYNPKRDIMNWTCYLNDGDWLRAKASPLINWKRTLTRAIFDILVPVPLQDPIEKWWSVGHSWRCRWWKHANTIHAGCSQIKLGHWMQCLNTLNTISICCCSQGDHPFTWTRHLWRRTSHRSGRRDGAYMAMELRPHQHCEYNHHPLQFGFLRSWHCDSDISLPTKLDIFKNTRLSIHDNATMCMCG